jgi:signal transduction histidine kinase
MAEPSPLSRSWQSVRDLPGRTPLRVKLITAVLALTAIALVVISIAGISVLRSYLLRQADDSLQSLARQEAFQGFQLDQQRYTPGQAVTWIPYSGPAQQIDIPDSVSGFGPESQQVVIPGPAIPANASSLPSSAANAITVPATSGGGRWRIIGLPASSNGSTTNGTLVLAINVSNVYGAIGQLTGLDLIVSALLLLVILMVGIGVVRASLRPLTDIEKTAGAIAAGDLTRRVPDRDPRTEVGRLGRSLNAMLAQIEAAFDARAESEFAARSSEERMRRFVADASHELRTPLTAIRGFAEYYRQRGGVMGIPGAPDRAALGNGLDTAAHEAETAEYDAGPADYDAGAGEYGAGAGEHGAGEHEYGAGAAEHGAGAGASEYDASAGDNEYGAGTAAHDYGAAEYEYGSGAAEHEYGVGAAEYGAIVSPRHGSNAEPIRTGPLTRPDLDRIMQRVEQESSRMGVLVEDMLLLARLDQQRPLEHRPVDMLTLAADAVHDARVVAPDRSINLTVGTGAALLVLGDEVRLRQVIGNLMSNALNHTPDGTPIEVRVRSGSLDEWRMAAAAAGVRIAPGDSDVQPSPAVVLEVADQGVGLTPEQAQHVFERFYRGDQARTRPGGTGLGLAIVASLVAAHGGRVWVESTPGRGATFRIAIPLAPEAMHIGPDLEDSTNPDILNSGRTLTPRLADPPEPPREGQPSWSADPPEPRHEEQPSWSADPPEPPGEGQPPGSPLPKRRPGYSGHAHR